MFIRNRALLFFVALTGIRGQEGNFRRPSSPEAEADNRPFRSSEK
jgi:hypothetical protein